LLRDSQTQATGNILMRVLITGGAGFIGAWTARLLIDKGHDVTSLDLSNTSGATSEILGHRISAIEWVTGDVVRYDDVAAAAESCHAIIHLAGLLTPACQRDPILGAQVNVIGPLNAFEVAKRKGMNRIIYASSVSVFGPDNSAVPFPTTHYGAFKLAVEGSARAYYEDSQISSIGFRPAVVYGLGRETGLTAGLTEACKAAVESRPFTIKFSGEVPVVYVEDVARALVDALTVDIQGAHVCNLIGDVVTVERFIHEIDKAIPSAEIQFSGPVVPFAAKASVDPVTACLPNFSYISLDQAVDRTVKAFSSTVAA
jgi:UDP-glucose 4-epimerase